MNTIQIIELCASLAPSVLSSVESLISASKGSNPVGNIIGTDLRTVAKLLNTVADDLDPQPAAKS